MKDSSKFEKVLQAALRQAQAGVPVPALSEEDGERVARIMEVVQAGKNKSVLAVLITLLVKKVVSPKQDIRLHRADLRNGFSGRGLDTNIITPFLKANNFPAPAESAWVTRSFEHPSPYTMDYPGKISPKRIKVDFLQLLDKVQKETKLAESLLVSLFSKMVALREKQKNLRLARPKNRTISRAVAMVAQLWENNMRGASRIPVLAVYAAYRCLVKEAGRYKDHELLPLLPHNAADERTKRSGDIDLAVDGKTVEAVEIKHGKKIDARLVLDISEKIKGTTVKRYYVLSTNEEMEQMDQITDLTIAAFVNHECEIIVNGVARTLKYYLRLVTNTDDFIDEFVTALEEDEGVSYDIKMLWANSVSE